MLRRRPVPVADLSLAELTAWGEDFGRRLNAPALIALSGDLGTGKTTLVQAIARGLGVRDDVTSPTYALVHRYEGVRGAIYHLDLYRIRSPRELVQVGWDELLSGDDVVLVEWPERAGDALPAQARWLSLSHLDGRTDVRRLEWTD